MLRRISDLNEEEAIEDQTVAAILLWVLVEICNAFF